MEERDATLSVVEQETLECIKAFLLEKGYAPSVRELAAHAGVTETAIIGRLNRLERKGRIKRAPKRARAITVTDDTP